MFFHKATTPIMGEFNGLEITLLASELRIDVLLRSLYQPYQARYVRRHGADWLGALVPHRPADLSAVVQVVTAWLPQDFDTVSGRVNLPITINNLLRQRASCIRVLILPQTDLKIVEQHPDWWRRCEYVGVTSISAALDELPRMVMGASFDDVISRLLLEAQALAMMQNISVRQGVEAVVRKAFDQAGVRLRGHSDYPSEACRFQLLLTTYALLAHPELNPVPFMEALTLFPQQAPLEYFTDTNCINWRGEDGFQQLIYEALLYPIALESERLKADASSTFTHVQRFKKVLRFAEDAAIFLPRVELWLTQIE